MNVLNIHDVLLFLPVIDVVYLLSTNKEFKTLIDPHFWNQYAIERYKLNSKLIKMQNTTLTPGYIKWIEGEMLVRETFL